MCHLQIGGNNPDDGGKTAEPPAQAESSSRIHGVVTTAAAMSRAPGTRSQAFARDLGGDCYGLAVIGE